ncbi:hypothetical protein M2347_002540 [Chryseobacterium sp. H1D6B]|uniref:hypothetical protein n=1 Tax=Chryseobacterium sp. H1D6B TaxID=2940588 RepID=UPI0015C8DDB0|nr:hypothetical protein [Chryseobacterium sp. H1D6B]MDH6252813.1 hypothetical protein [Chryseobacterium sp. H1D6B]
MKSVLMMKNNFSPAVLIVLFAFNAINAQESFSPDNQADIRAASFQKVEIPDVSEVGQIGRLTGMNVSQPAPSVLFSNLSAHEKTLDFSADREESHRLAPWFVRRFHFEGGLFIPFNNTNVHVGSNSGAYATDIDFENDLGFNTSSFSAFANFQWHISRRSKLKLSYFNLSRSADHTLDKTIEFADHTFPVYADVSAFFNSHIAQISYGYAVVSRPKYELGVMIGAHVLKVDVGIGLNTNVGSVGYSTDYDFTAPLPDIGVYGGYAISDQWAVNAELGYLSAKINNINGKIISYNLAVQYNPLPYLGFSASYTGLNFELDVDGKHMDGFLKWGYNGPSLAATYTFGRGF